MRYRSAVLLVGAVVVLTAASCPYHRPALDKTPPPVVVTDFLSLPWDVSAAQAECVWRSEDQGGAVGPFTYEPLTDVSTADEERWSVPVVDARGSRFVCVASVAVDFMYDLTWAPA